MAPGTTAQTSSSSSALTGAGSLRSRWTVAVASEWHAAMSCVMYSFCSVAMILVNKAIPEYIPIELRWKIPQFSVITFQCLIAVILVDLSKRLGCVEYPPFEISIALKWLPVNILFIGMLLSGFMSLVYLSVPMVTVFKNLAYLFTLVGDWLFFRELPSQLTLVSIFIISVGAVMTAINDIQFNATGYMWMAANCFFTGMYIVYMRHASATIKLPRFGMIFYNNLLSVVLLLPFCFIGNELEVIKDPAIISSSVIVGNILAGLIGFYLNFASLWCVSATSATTYSIIGSFNKVPSMLIGAVLFQTKISIQGAVFIALSTIGTFIHVYSKLPSGK